MKILTGQMYLKKRNNNKWNFSINNNNNNNNTNPIVNLVLRQILQVCLLKMKLKI